MKSQVKKKICPFGLGQIFYISGTVKGNNDCAACKLNYLL